VTTQRLSAKGMGRTNTVGRGGGQRRWAAVAIAATAAAATIVALPPTAGAHHEAGVAAASRAAMQPGAAEVGPAGKAMRVAGYQRYRWRVPTMRAQTLERQRQRESERQSAPEPAYIPTSVGPTSIESLEHTMPGTPRQEFYAPRAATPVSSPPVAAPVAYSAPAAPTILGETGIDLQVGSFRRYENALALKSKLASRYANVYVTPFSFRGGEYHRVRVGGFSSMDELRTTESALARAGFRPMRVRNR